VKHGAAALVICSTAFEVLGKAQAKALGYADLPISIVPHPFGKHTRAEIRVLANKCAADIVAFSSVPSAGNGGDVIRSDVRATRLQLPDDMEEINRVYRERGWTDGLPIMVPAVEKVQAMVDYIGRAPDEIVSCIPPGFGAATIELIATNAVMAGCSKQQLPLLIAAAQAVAARELNLQSIQVTTNPAAVLLIANGPMVRKLGMNSGINCLGQGNWTNAVLGRGLRLILQNIGGAAAGKMDRATHGQPGKYSFFCPENEAQSPWEPLHVEKGFRAEQNTVTVVGAEGTLNMNAHTKKAEELLRIFSETLARPTSNDYRIGLGNPWIILGPEHAAVLHAAGLSKADVKQRLWEDSKMLASRLSGIDMERMQWERQPELGRIAPHTMIPICASPDNIGILVAGGPGTHSVFVPSFGITQSVSQEVIFPE